MTLSATSHRPPGQAWITCRASGGTRYRLALDQRQAEIAQRLLAVGRTIEAWEAIDAINADHPGWIPFEWEQTRLDVLEALGRAEEAQAFRWDCFERALDGVHLRAHLKRLPDFEDVETEERALSLALRYPSAHQALAFLVS